MEQFGEILAEFKRELGLEQSDQLDSAFEVTVDGLPVEISLQTRAGEQQVVLYADLCTITERRELDVYRVLLNANVLWTLTDECTLGVNANTRQANLCCRMGLAGLDGRALAMVVDTFANNARRWTGFIEDMQAADESPHQGGAAQGEFLIRI